VKKRREREIERRITGSARRGLATRAAGLAAESVSPLPPTPAQGGLKKREEGGMEGGGRRRRGKKGKL